MTDTNSVAQLDVQAFPNENEFNKLDGRDTEITKLQNNTEIEPTIELVEDSSPHVVLLYDKLQFNQSNKKFDELISENPEAKVIHSFYEVTKELFSSRKYEHLHIYIEYNDEFEKNMNLIAEILENNKEYIKIIEDVSYFIQFDFEKKWSKVSESEKKAYNEFLKTLSTICGKCVHECSILNKYDMETIYVTDKDQLAKLGQEIQDDLSYWPNLKICDYGDNFIRFFPGVKFPESLEILRIGGGYSLETLSGFKLPSKLRILDASQGSINSIDNVVFSPSLERLDLVDNKIYFLNYVQLPLSLLSLDLSQNRIDNLRGVNFPHNLKSLSLAANPIECIKGVKFPESLEYLDISYIPNESMTGVKFPDSLIHLNLQQSMTNTRGLKLPLRILSLNISRNGVNSINPLKLPNSIQTLHLGQNNIKTLNKVQFPISLKELYLGDNLITTLKNIHFPDSLEILDINMDQDWEEYDKYLTTLKDVTLPQNLRVLRLSGHKIKSLESIEFPPLLEELCLANNGLKIIRNVRLGNRLKILDLSENNDLLGVDMLLVPDCVKKLMLAEHQVGNLPAYLIERANKRDLEIQVSPTPQGYYRKWDGYS